MTYSTGIWTIGAFGGVASTAAVGLSALVQGLVEPTALVSALPQFIRVPFMELSGFVWGGHEIRQTNLLESAQRLAIESRAFDLRLVDQVEESLRRWSLNVRPGYVRHCGRAVEELVSPGFVQTSRTPREMIDGVKKDLEAFRKEQKLDRILMVNLASTEPFPDPELERMAWVDLEKRLGKSDAAIPSSTLYAIAAMELGCPYINFTPSVGSNLDALRELAELKKVPHVGRDGKTGETFMKSVLAPALAARNLNVLSWVGHNIFGNMDGQVLDDPVNKSTKVKSKDSLLANILGYSPQTHTSIEYIRSLGDWKTAWDHIHFRGFLGTPMILQFIWQGCDSILAAPLVLDLVRFVEVAARHGEVGEMGWLASFFKSPQGTREQEFSRQFSLLQSWADQFNEE